MSAQSTTHGATSSTRKPECLSMTGYATARCEHQGWSIRVSVKSVNHRFLDVKLRMPESLEPYEIRLRQAVRERIHRGHVDIHVSVEPGKAAPVHVNQELLQAYLRAADELRQQTKAKAELDLVSLLRLPGVIGGLAPELPDSEEEQEELGKILETQLREALTRMDEMRRAEGRHLSEELRERTMRIGTLVEQVRGLVEALRPAFARRLDSRLKELLGGNSIDPARLAQEAALLAERSDISEELDRLRSHLQQFTQLLDGAGELGKKLDFLLQEMQREANTMLSKTPGVENEALAITGIALEIKAEIEKLREQVQNIE
ncbi:MAG TPA: YicC/YloC family endoribonuclease [Candidatus Dormibacteraeota bacterium]|nr:YicC/YloC family endoribonuclease [Candidatus Dormibacteraeota bacterium]